jgi:KipI family sensor histidine kinase inhibitor
VEVRRYGTRALLISPREVALLIDHPGVVEVVPGAETVLVVVRDADAVDSVGDSVEALEAGNVRSDVADDSGREVVLDVVYDGEDLADVAAASGLSVESVIALHSGALYRCDFCGFAPGFAYLSGLDPRLHLPRRATPRASVPAGSVAIAGAYTAAYPSASPGGWNLIGRTDALLWDLADDPPALIPPGTTVRFRARVARSGRPTAPKTDRRPPRRGTGPEAAQNGNPVLRVITVGVATSLQDRGRAGYAHLAVPGSGALDRRSADLVNRLVGNPPDAAALETAGGLVLEAIAPATVADSTTGAVQALRPGMTISVDPAPGESWAYLAVRGGFEGQHALGSRSWDGLSKLGPPPPEPGDTMNAGPDPATPVATDQAPHPTAQQAIVVNVSVGPRADWFAPDAMDQLTTTAWTVAATSRVGLRLTGQALIRTRTEELPSEGLVLGAIQVPPDGQPVVMLADHPTTGGYPVLAVVDDDDIGRLVQRPPGSTVRFRPNDQVGTRATCSVSP